MCFSEICQRQLEDEFPPIGQEYLQLHLEIHVPSRILMFRSQTRYLFEMSMPVFFEGNRRRYPRPNTANLRQTDLVGQGHTKSRRDAR